MHSYRTFQNQKLSCLPLILILIPRETLDIINLLLENHEVIWKGINALASGTSLCLGISSLVEVFPTTISTDIQVQGLVAWLNDLNSQIIEVYRLYIPHYEHMIYHLNIVLQNMENGHYRLGPILSELFEDYRCNAGIYVPVIPQDLDQHYLNLMRLRASLFHSLQRIAPDLDMDDLDLPDEPWATVGRYNNQVYDLAWEILSLYEEYWMDVVCLDSCLFS